MKLKYILTLSILVLVAVFSSACSTLDVYVETAAPSEGAVANVTETLTPQATLHATAVESTPPPVPTLESTPVTSPTEGVTTAPALQPTPSSPIAGLFYRLGDQLFRINPDGQLIPLAPGLDPQVLPGQFTPRAVFSTDGKYMISWWDFSDIWLVNLTTGESQNLTQTADRVEYSAQFWPARPDTIIFMSQPVEEQGPSAGYLSTIQLDGSGYRVLDDTASSIGLPALSPDGQTIAYDRGGEAWLYRWDRGPETINLTDFNVSETLKLANPAWSPKGKYLAWMVTIGPASSDSRAGVALFDMESNTYHLIHTFQSPGHGGWYNTPLWSPDGAWLAVFDESSSQPGIWIVHPDGSGETQIYAASSVRSVGGLLVMWSPDSKTLLVLDPNAEGGIRADLIDIFTGDKTTLEIPAGSIPLAWLY